MVTAFASLRARSKEEVTLLNFQSGWTTYHGNYFLSAGAQPSSSGLDGRECIMSRLSTSMEVWSVCVPNMELVKWVCTAAHNKFKLHDDDASVSDPRQKAPSEGGRWSVCRKTVMILERWVLSFESSYQVGLFLSPRERTQPSLALQHQQLGLFLYYYAQNLCR